MALRALLAAALAAALLPAAATAQTPAAPDGRVVFPAEDLTVADPTQLTGRRMALPLPNCFELPTECAEIRGINELDGFDLDLRVAVQLDAAPEGDLAEVFGPTVLRIVPASGGQPIGLNRLVYDEQTLTLYGQPALPLAESTSYRAVYRDSSVAFTTLSASAGLVQLRRQLDQGSAYQSAGIAPGDRGLTFAQGELRTVFDANQVVRVTRYNEVRPGGELVAEPAFNSAVANAGRYAFGSFLSPQWLRDDVTIAPAPTAAAGPPAIGSARVGVVVVTPAGTPPADGWPVAIFGPGITRSKYDAFLAADFNAAEGIATISLDPVGHAYGPASEVGVQTRSAPAEVRFLGHGRGRDLNRDGVIANDEGVQAPAAPHPSASVALRDGLRQTAADVMALVRALALGADIDGDGTADLSRTDISLYAQSLGGIYGTMVMGADPRVGVGVLNVPGGPILDIARLAPGFRGRVQLQLRNRIPALLNGGRAQFTESMPLALDPPMMEPAPGALEIQHTSAMVNWLNRPGSPDAFAPLLVSRPLADAEPKKVLYQFAFGDRTVPNPTSANLVRAFGEPGKVSFYRNDRTATAGTNPHGFLLDPQLQGRNQGQLQVVRFIDSKGETVLDPDGPAPTWEVPIADPATLDQLNFSADLYGPDIPAPAQELERVSGGGRVETAVAVSEATFEQAGTVVLARADEYADALAGGPLAAHLGAPLLLTPRAELPEAVAAEIERLGADAAVLLGGEGAIAPEVATALTGLGLTVRRVSGTTRFATAAAVAAELPHTSEVFVVEGANADPGRGWPDALAVSAVAAGLRQPILLVTREVLPDETADAIAEHHNATIVGGTAAVSDTVLAAVDEKARLVTRLSGSDRFTTAAAVATEGLLRGLDPSNVWITTGLGYADGLAAGAAAGASRGLLVLVDRADLSASRAAETWISSHHDAFERAVIVGGVGVVGERVEAQIRATLG